MKGKEFIKMLQELDPTGELEVVCGCGDIYFAAVEPAYYDGGLGVLLKDEEKKPFYHIRGMKFFSSGNKIRLHTMNYEDVIWDQDMNEMTFEYDSERTEEYMKSLMEKAQKEYKESLKDD